MRIVIDMQGAQTESRFRGVGRYTLSITQAIVRNRGEHEIILALSGLFPDTIEPIRAVFDDLLPQENIRVWHAPGPVKEEQPGNDARRKVAELIREAFLASLQPDVIHITSLFEGYVDDAVTSVGRFDTATPVSVTLHDLIPLLNPDHYLKPNPRHQQYYSRKTEALNNASLYLAVSESSKAEGKQCLSAPEEFFVNTSEAVEDAFCPLTIDVKTASQLREKFDITRPFILYTGGADERKNLPRLIEAYAALPTSLRNAHQLIFAGKMPEGNIAHLKDVGRSFGLKNDELVFTGYVSDEELIQLYNLCQLYVFPSWHEGFGLPVLEAMACGAPVIGANTSSLPEVIGLEEALFDPFDVKAINAKLSQALDDEAFRNRLLQHGLNQSKKFSWDETAMRAIAAWEKMPGRAQNEYMDRSLAHNRFIAAVAKQLAHSCEPELVTVSRCIAQNESTGIERQLLLDVSELCQHDSATGVQRVVRSYLKWLLQSPPAGFRVEPVFATRDEGYRYARRFTLRFLGLDDGTAEDTPVSWQRGDIFFGLDMQHHVQLAHADFYTQLRAKGVVVKFLVHDLLPIQLADLFKDDNAKELHEEWLNMIANHDEAICVSKATADAYEDWIANHDVETVPGFRTSWVHNGADIKGSKPSQGLPAEALDTLHKLKSRPTFLSVSTLEPRKAQEQLLDAVEYLWRLGDDVNLLLVGQQGWKVDELVDRIVKHPEHGKRLFWLRGISDEYLSEVYKASTCLVAASINEGFGLPLIEAASHGIPIIARDIPVFREVAEEFAFYFNGETGEQLADAIHEWLKLYDEGCVPTSDGMDWSTWEQSAEEMKVALVRRNYPCRQLLVDISELVQRDAKSGIQRVVRNLLRIWLLAPPLGWRVEPIYATADHGYRYARKFLAGFLPRDQLDIGDEPIEVAPGDVFFGLDLAPAVVPFHRGFYQHLRAQGVTVKFVVYDLQPLIPDYFEKAHEAAFLEWLWVTIEANELICISNSVANDLKNWLQANAPERFQKGKISYFHLGAEIIEPVKGDINPFSNSEDLLNRMKVVPSFLMVSTLAPHKGHAQVLRAIEILWDSGVDVNLILIGKNGWCVDDLVSRLKVHPELGRRLFWLDGVSDKFLETLYRNATCLIAASYTEGFGLPLIEAAQYQLPIIARDIPIFQEVAGSYAYYFDNTEPEGLAGAVKHWLELYQKCEHPIPDNMPWLTWKESAQQLLNLIIPDNTSGKETKKEAS